MKKLKIALICPHPEDVAPGQRLKYEQYLNYLRTQGYDIDVYPFMSDRFWNIVYKKGFLLEKIFWTICGFIKRWCLIPKLFQYDGMYIFLNVTPLGFPVLEWIYTRIQPNFIYDIDDLVFLGRTTKHNSLVSILKNKSKYHFLMKRAKHAIVCTPYLEEYVNQFNSHTTDISSTINTEVFIPKYNVRPNEPIRLGWSGSHSTLQYLHILDKVIQRVNETHPVKLMVLGGTEFSLANIEVTAHAWTLEEEVPFMQQFDIGLYPLPLNDSWVMGKSGLKALQYMSLGIPTIATAIGANYRIIENNKTGILVKTEDEWYEAIMHLINHPEERIRIGNNARKVVESTYSVKANEPAYLKIFDEVYKKKSGK